MPPKETNGDWLVNSGTGKLYIRESDGGFVPFAAIREVRHEDILTHEEAERFKYGFAPSDLIGKTFTFTGTFKLTHKGQIERARLAKSAAKYIKRFNNKVRRINRTIKRQAELERRRRLKEGQHEHR